VWQAWRHAPRGRTRWSAPTEEAIGRKRAVGKGRPGRLESRPQARKPAPQGGGGLRWRAQSCGPDVVGSPVPFGIVWLCRRDRRHGKPGGLLHENCRCGTQDCVLHGEAGVASLAACSRGGHAGPPLQKRRLDGRGAVGKGRPGRLESRPQARKPAPQGGGGLRWRAQSCGPDGVGSPVPFGIVWLCRRDRRHGKPGGLLHENCRCGTQDCVLHGEAGGQAWRHAPGADTLVRPYRRGDWTEEGQSAKGAQAGWKAAGPHKRGLSASDACPTGRSGAEERDAP
jgi:hypothetical protein